MPRAFRSVFVIGLLVVTALSACDSSGSSGSSASTTSRPVSRDPALRARVFCNRSLQREITASIGVAPTRVTKARLADHMYSCRYEFAGATIALSLKGFPDATAARHYFDEQARLRGRRPEPPMLGEGMRAFVTTDGSMIVRKGADILDVDAHTLPPQFGDPPQDRALVSLAVAVTIIGHWVPG